MARDCGLSLMDITWWPANDADHEAIKCRQAAAACAIEQRLGKDGGVPKLPYVTVNLPTSKPTHGMVEVSAAELAWAAVTVGTNPHAIPFVSRPRLELLWRASMTRATLRITSGAWARSAPYDRLDSSEKSAVSYFLGGVHAKLMTRRLMGVAHLVHYGALSGVASGTRPDFIGMDAAHGLTGVAVEAKGRSGVFQAGVVATALAQARSIRSIAGVTLTLPIAALSHHSANGRWRSHLEGIPGKRTRRLSITTVPEILGHYYEPLITALVDYPGTLQRDSIWYRLPLTDVDCVVSIPRFITDAFLDLDAGENRLEQAGRRIATRLMQFGLLDGQRDLIEDASLTSQHGRAASHFNRVPEPRPPDPEPSIFQGEDFVRVEVGDSWTTPTEPRS